MASPGGKLSSAARLMRSGEMSNDNSISVKKFILQHDTVLSRCNGINQMSPFFIRPGSRRATFPSGEGIAAYT